MKRTNDLKLYLTSYFNNLSRERIAIFICIPIAVVALCICATMLLLTDSSDKKTIEQEMTVTETTERIPIYLSNSPYSLEFESLENGCCSISGIGNFQEKELKIGGLLPKGLTVRYINNKLKDIGTTIATAYFLDEQSNVVDEMSAVLSITPYIGLPQIKVSTLNGALIDSKENYTTASISVENCSTEHIIT